MNVANINDAKFGFQILQTTLLSQTAVMTLAAGDQSSEEPNVHKKSDQVLLIIEGEVQAEVAGERRILRQGDVCVVPAGTPHRFLNQGKDRALTFTVYTPPEYAADKKE